MRPRRRSKRAHAPRGFNPYFRRGGGEGVLKQFIIGSSAALGLALAGFLLFSPAMNVKGVLATGATGEVNEDVEQFAMDFLGRRRATLVSRSHRWFIPQERLTRRLLETYPLNAVQMERREGSLVIELNEKIGLFHVVKNDTMYAVDREGAILYAVDDLDRIRIQLERQRGEGPPLILDRRASSAEEPEDVSAQTLETIVAMFQLIQGSNMLSPILAEISDEPGRVNIETDAGLTLYMTTDRPIEAQMSKLQLLVDKQLVDISVLDYIDLRFENRLYYH